MKHFVIGIGASAGGLQALKEFFTHRQTTSGESYVIVLHSLRNYKSKLVEILSTITHIPLSWITDGLPVEPNRIYVSPSSDKIELSVDKFRLLKRGDREIVNFTINYFFESLAQAAKEKAIGIIMSGTGTDGTSGAHVIEDHGGIVLVQNPKTAQFDGMPMTSIRYDHPDYILAPKEMPALIDTIISGKEDKRKRKAVALAAYY